MNVWQRAQKIRSSRFVSQHVPNVHGGFIGGISTSLIGLKSDQNSCDNKRHHKPDKKTFHPAHVFHQLQKPRKPRLTAEITGSLM